MNRIKTMKLGKTDYYWIQNHHIAMAYYQLGFTKIPCDVWAVWHIEKETRKSLINKGVLIKEDGSFVTLKECTGSYTAFS